MTVIYILRYSDSKYYVGKSDTVVKRIDNHFYKNGSSWTKKYIPICVEKIIDNCDDYDEDKWTLKYMKIYENIWYR